MGIRSRLRSMFSPEVAEAPPPPVLSNHVAANPALNLHCSEFEVNGWDLSEFICTGLVPIVGVHPFPVQELLLMCSAVTRLQPPMIFEWGTNIGKSARIFHEVARHYGVTTVIHSVDLPDDEEHVEHPHSQRGMLVKRLPDVQLHQGDGLTTSIRIWQEAGSPSGALFFLDGDHSYASVKRELDGVISVAPEAALLLHDTFYQSAESGYNIGPCQAIKEVIARHPSRFQVLRTELSLPGMTLLIPHSARP